MGGKTSAAAQLSSGGQTGTTAGQLPRHFIQNTFP
jgi:hypothetical protein